MNTKALNSLAELIYRAQEQDRTPMGVAFAIDSAGRHMSPEVAAELERLRSEVAALQVERHSTNESLSEAAEQLRADRDRIAELEAELRIGSPWTCHVCGKGNRRDVCVICETDRPDPSETARATTEDDDPARCLKAHPFSPRDGWRLICTNCDHSKDAACHNAGGVE